MNPIIDHSDARTAALPHVQEVLQSAERELTGLLRQREDLMRRIGTIKQVVAAMSDLFGESILHDELRVLLHGQTSKARPGFTVACRQVLMRSRTPLSVRHCSDELRRRFPDLAERHRDLTASVGTVLRRLAAYGEARYHLDGKGNRLWEWIGSASEAMPETRAVSSPMTTEPGRTSSPVSG